MRSLLITLMICALSGLNCWAAPGGNVITIIEPTPAIITPDGPVETATIIEPGPQGAKGDKGDQGPQGEMTPELQAQIDDKAPVVSPVFSTTAVVNQNALPLASLPNPAGSGLRIYGADGPANTPRIATIGFGSAATFLGATYGGTAAALTPLTTGYKMGSLLWMGNRTTTGNMSSAAHVTAFATENWDTTHAGSGISMMTILRGGTSYVTPLVLTGGGNVIIGNAGQLFTGDTQGGSKLEVTGKAFITAGLHVGGLSTHNDNAAALAAGKTPGDTYQSPSGRMMVTAATVTGEASYPIADQANGKQYKIIMINGQLGWEEL